MKYSKPLVLGISEEVGWSLYHLPNLEKLIELFRVYLMKLYNNGIEEFIIVVGDRWRHKFAKFLVNLDLDIELIILHNIEWFRGSGTILASLGEIVNSNIVMMYNALASYNLIRRFLEEEDYLFGVCDRDRVMEIFRKELKLKVYYNGHIHLHREGEEIISGPFMFKKEVFSISKRFNMIYDRFEISDILKTILLGCRVKALRIHKDDLIPLDKLVTYKASWFRA